MKYVCNLCNKDFKQKSNYNVHINRKRPCVNIITDNDLLENNLSPNTANLPPNTANLLSNNLCCIFCNKNFTRKDVLNRHINYRCKQNKLL